KVAILLLPSFLSDYTQEMFKSPPLKKSRNDVDDNCIRFIVNDISKLRENGEVYSGRKSIANFPWSVGVGMTTDDSLEAFLFCY
ncbi:hypothetical protein PENTCL1PPCAC_23235, partial [Pristionchus entomophagus]